MVKYEDRMGWARFRKGPLTVLVPAMEGREGARGVRDPAPKGFSWDGLEALAHPQYYKVRSDLPAKVELKVRYRPLPTATVVGQVRPGQVVEVWAIAGNWLQIRYQKVDAAWVQWRLSRADHQRAPSAFQRARSALLSAVGRRPPQENPNGYMEAVNETIETFKEQQRLIWKMEHVPARPTHVQLQLNLENQRVDTLAMLPPAMVTEMSRNKDGTLFGERKAKVVLRKERMGMPLDEATQKALAAAGLVRGV